MTEVKVIVNNIFYPAELNEKIAAEIKDKKLISVQTTGFSSLGYHKMDYAIVTLVLEDNQ